jgi:hypothetical protein
MPPAFQNSTLQFHDLFLLLLQIGQPIDCDDGPPLADVISALTLGLFVEDRCKFLVANVYVFIIEDSLFEDIGVIGDGESLIFAFVRFIESLVKGIKRKLAIYLLRYG